MSQMQLAIEFKRLQFPLRLGFAMSINKSQGQTIKIVGLHLQEHCFMHGQFYVGCSRVVCENVVYQEVLWFVLTSYFPCKIVFLSYATLIAVSAYAYVAYFYSVAPLFIFKSSVVEFCLFCHYDAMLLHHCAYVRVHSCCLYFFHSIQCDAVAPRCVCNCWFVEFWLLFYPLHCNAPLCIWKYWFVQFNIYCLVVSLTLMQC